MFLKLIRRRNADKKLNINRNAVVRFKNGTSEKQLVARLNKKVVKLSGGVKLK